MKNSKVYYIIDVSQRQSPGLHHKSPLPSVIVYANTHRTDLIIIIINTHGRFAIAFLPLTTRLSTELFEAIFIKKSSG